IHRESGISVGGIYRYFAGKQEILMTIAAREQERLNEVLTRVVTESATPQEFLGSLMTSLEAFRDSHPVDVDRLAVAGWLEAAENAELRRLLAESYAQLAAALDGRLGEWGIPPEDRAGLRHMLRTLVLGHVAVGVIEPGAAPAPSIDGLSALARFVDPRAAR
ncbi:TetR/AcrR family transcriptional regulator, partial [Leucobacter sp. M11]|uniref:TetR/AcrR family transcriptional regulator n=1 Tax=Leucobacter sp. M11 TaxID=2993565 RepID=UPI002D80B20C